MIECLLVLSKTVILVAFHFDAIEFLKQIAHIACLFDQIKGLVGLRENSLKIGELRALLLFLVLLSF